MEARLEPKPVMTARLSPKEDTPVQATLTEQHGVIESRVQEKGMAMAMPSLKTNELLRNAEGQIYW